MRVRALPVILWLAVGMSVLSWAKQPALHDIAWYKAHPKEREVTLRMCHNNQSLQSASDDCTNAERADATTPWQGQPSDPFSYMDTPAWMSQHTAFRDGILNICQHPEKPGAQMWLRYCGPARASAGAAR